MSKLSRVGWGLMAGLFLVTSGALTALFFIVSRNNSSQPNKYITCTQGAKVPNQQPGKDGKVKGAKLADYSPPQKVDSIACIDYKVGTGATVQSSSTVTVNYVGALASNGTIFDDSIDSGSAFTTSLNGVIAGWQIGLPGMKAGGIRRLFIPAQLAYGPTAQNGIPANSDLIFDVQLANVQ